MKKLFLISAVAFLFLGCATFGSFPNLKKGKSSQDEVLSMLGTPAKKSFKNEKEIWSYQFLKKSTERSADKQVLLNLDISFKDKEVENYDITVSQESREAGDMNKEQQPAKALPMPAGKGRMPAGRGQGPAAPVRGPGGNFIQDLDADGDGLVSRDEFPGPDEVFRNMDKNSDGVIDGSEAPKGRGARQ